MKTKRNEDYPNLLYIILLQNLCCINRTHYIEKKLYKILGNIIFYVSLITIIGFNIYDILAHIRDHTKLKDLSTSIKFSYIFQWILGVELVPLAIAAKQKLTIYEQLKLLGGKCGIIPNIIRNKLTTKDFSKGIGKEIILSLISIIIDTIGLISLEYPASVIITLAVSFAAHDTELLFYSLIIEEFNGKLTTLMDVSAEMGTKMYRHILIAASHYSKDFKFTICLTVISTLATTVIYIGASIVLEGSRLEAMFGISLRDKIRHEVIHRRTRVLTHISSSRETVVAQLEELIGKRKVEIPYKAHKVLSYFIWREIRSLFSMWLLCSASFQTRILCSNLVKRLSRRLVFELDSKDKASRGLTKRWLRCVKSSPVRYLNGSCYTLSPTLPLVVLDYTTNYLLIIVQVYPLITSKSKKSQGQSV